MLIMHIFVAISHLRFVSIDTICGYLSIASQRSYTVIRIDECIVIFYDLSSMKYERATVSRELL
jgi:hypothetical protein